MAELALLVRSGPQAGTRIPILASVVLGREQADVVINDQLVSRRHVCVRPVEGALEVEDLRSLNGTWVNGALLQGVRRLAGGDVLCIGDTTLEIVFAGPVSGPSGEAAERRVA